MTRPYFRLKELMIEKFGENKLSTGYLIVSRWVTFETKQKVDKDLIEMMCDTSKAWTIDRPTEDSLMKLFGLKRREQLYTFPEQMPAY